MAHVNDGSHTVLPAIHTFIHKWNKLYVPSLSATEVGWLEFNIPFQHKYGYIRDETPAQPQGITTLWPLFIVHPAEDRRLSQPGWLTTY